MRSWRRGITIVLMVFCMFGTGVSSCIAEERGLGIDFSSLLGEQGLGDSLGNLGSLGGLLELFGQTSGRTMKNCKISSIPDQTYTGKAVRPVPTVTYNGTKLIRGTDFTLTYSNNTKVGTGKCTIKGKGLYSGTRTVSFRIKRKNSSSGSGASTSKTKKFTLKLSQTSYIYNGKTRKPTVKVTAGGKSVTSSNYTVTYKNNKSVGKATVTVKGKGDYRGYSGETTFKITLKKTSLTSASSPEEGIIKAGWNKDSQADGYQLQYCTNKSFGSNVKKATVSEGGKQTYQKSGLTSGKKYYVRIRSYRKVGSTNWYSEWSAARQVKVK